MEHGTETWKAFLADGRKLVGATTPYQMSGRLTRINGLVMEASGLKLPLGSGCLIIIPGGSSVEAEVVVHGEKIFLIPTDDVFGLAPGAQVLRPVPQVRQLPPQVVRPAPVPQARPAAPAPQRTAPGEKPDERRRR